MDKIMQRAWNVIYNQTRNTFYNYKEVEGWKILWAIRKMTWEHKIVNDWPISLKTTPLLVVT